MFANFHVAFTVLSLCYAQCLGYLFHTMFPFLSILQHYVEFNTCTVITLEKSLGVGSFGGSMNDRVLLDMFGLSFMVRIVAPVFLGCWALIALTLVIHFQ